MEDFIETFKISNNPLDDLIKYLDKYGSIKIFIENKDLKKDIFNVFKETKFNLTIHHLQSKTKQYIDKLEYSGEDIVVACGSGSVGDCAKYYAASFSLPVVCVYVDDFFDYNLSKFSLVYDGVCSDFYEAVSPIAFFIKHRTEFKQMEAYARAKSIEYFDFKFNEVLLQDKLNEDAKQFFKNTILELRLENYNFVAIVKAFLRLGMGMTFFNSTKYFLFGYFDLVNLLGSMNDKQCCTNASSLISKVYLLTFKYKITTRPVSVNIIINSVAKDLKVPSFCVLKSVKKLQDSVSVKNDIIKLNAYKEYLKTLLLRSLVAVKDYKIDKKFINILNYATFFSTRKSLLKTLNESGMIKV